MCECWKPLSKCVRHPSTGVSSSASVFVNHRFCSVPRKFKTPRTPSRIYPPEKVFLPQVRTFLLLFPFTPPSSSTAQCLNCKVFFQPSQEACYIDLRSFRGIKFLWHLFPASGEIISAEESPVKVEKSVEILYLFFSPIIFSFGCCPWCRWWVTERARPCFISRSTSP